MKLVRPAPFYTWCFLLSMPFISFALCFIMYGERLYHEAQLWVTGYLIVYTIGIFSWLAHYQYDYFLQTRFPGIDFTRKRVAYKLLINILIMSPSVLLIFYVFHWLHVGGYALRPGDLRKGILVGISVNIIFETLYEVVYIIDNYKETAAEKELLEQMHLQQEFDNLKRKVNPHFLFNCFNTLSSLINEDRQHAERFLNELSKVYRYLLRNNEDGMSTLENEVKFIAGYFNLLHTRYGDGVKLNMRIDKKYNNYLLPSLSLQLLLENAVKHNVVSKQAPLSVEIFTTEDGQLVVNNNLNLKVQKEKSTRIGLQNIRDKYRLLQGKDEVQVVDGARNFMVVLPLIWDKSKHN